jgi:hypothetical protein
MPQTDPSELPPLILHPFSAGAGPVDVLESSRAALILAGLLPGDDTAADALTRKLLKGRWEEIRMLCFVGKDVHRWLDQCVEFASRRSDLAGLGLPRQSFAELLVRHPPPEVPAKLRNWGVDEYANIFLRAIGLATVFPVPPPPSAVQTEFVMNYHRFADGMYAAFLQLEPWKPITGAEFPFTIYTSGEYSRMLESEWSEPPAV